MMPNNGGEVGGAVGPSMGGGAEGGSGVSLKKGPWTSAEDAILIDYVRKHGEGNWNAVQKNSGLARCGKSCRLRWANHLRPNLKKGAFTPDEERLILELHAKYGNKWARMASQLPGRTDNEIKNYWNTRVKRRQRQGLPLYPHDIPNSQSHSQPTTPTTPTAPTTPTTPNSPIFHFHHHTQPPLPLSSTPPSHSPLSPSKTNTNYTTSLPLFDPTTNTSSSFTFHRPTPILGTPMRFKRLRNSSGFSLPLSPNTQNSSSLTSPNSLNNITPLGQLTTTQFPGISSFQFPLSSFTRCHNNSPQLMRTQLELDHMVPPVSVYPVKQELPSSQLFSNMAAETSSEITIDTKVNAAMNHGNGNTGLLEDLLEEAQAFAAVSNHGLRTQRFLDMKEEKHVLDGFGHWDGSNSINCSLGVKPKEEPGVQMNSMRHDLSKLLNVMPSNMQVPDWYGDSGEISNGQSSGVTDDNMGLDMQHISSLFPLSTTTDRGRNPGSCSWDNLPGIC